MLVVGALDYVTGNEVSFSIFYVIPIIMLVMATNEQMGVVISVISATIWMLVEYASGANYSSVFVYIWNTIVRLVFFLLTVLLVKYGKALERERLFSRTDFLTGAFTGRYFYELAQMEIDRSIRYQHPLTIVYIDVDNFKAINDQFGHSAGDKVLTAIVACIKQHLRKTDMVARVGGDEFVVLFPELDEMNARMVIPKLQRTLLQETQQGHWSVTCSIGALTFISPPASVDEMLSLADQAMYSVKNNGKNAILFDVYPSLLDKDVPLVRR